jgi:two-component system OmpR family sensor kinase
MALAAVTRVLTPMLLLLPVLSVVIWVIVGRGLTPLRRLARAVALRTPSGLEPLPVTDTPEEVLPLVQSLNDLLRRLDEALAGQRAFVADAAHELRTPIAALQLQVQMLERAASDAERQAAVDDLQAGVRRGAHLVNQLLTLARQEPDLTDRPKSAVPLGELARTTVAEHVIVAEERQIDLGMTHTDDAAIVEGNADGLRILLRNLVDNALRYTPAGGAVDVAVSVSGPDAVLDVTDDGPGIPPEDRQRVFARFYRGSGTGETGTGLGLSIVKSIADRHGARVELDSSATGGLRVRVRFPRFQDAESKRGGG